VAERSDILAAVALIINTKLASTMRAAKQCVLRNNVRKRHGREISAVQQIPTVI